MGVATDGASGLLLPLWPIWVAVIAAAALLVFLGAAYKRKSVDKYSTGHLGGGSEGSGGGPDGGK